MSAELERIEQIIDASGVADTELLLPTGVRPRQLKVTTLLIGMTLAMRAGRQAFLTEVHKTLTALPTEDQRRLGVIAQWKHAEHRLTYRQVEYTFDRVIGALATDTPDGTPSERLHDVLDRLLEASVQVLGEPTSSSYAIDWTDQETWSLPPPKKPSTPATPAAANRVEDTTPDDHDGGHAANDTTPQPPPTPGCADPEASWGHRRGDAPGQDDELFFGYYLQAATTVKDEHGPDVPELARRIHLSSCDHDPPPAFVPVLERMHPTGITISDVLADSGYSYRVPERWAVPVRALGAELIVDLHPNDRGPHGTHHGATCQNGNLYCPATPTTLLQLGPLPRGASAEQTVITRPAVRRAGPLQALPHHQTRPRRLPPGAPAPAAQETPRRPHRPPSPTSPNDRPTILDPPERPPVLLHPENDHRAAVSGNAKDSPEARRPLRRRTAPATATGAPPPSAPSQPSPTGATN